MVNAEALLPRQPFLLIVARLRDGLMVWLSRKRRLSVCLSVCVSLPVCVCVCVCIQVVLCYCQSDTASPMAVGMEGGVLRRTVAGVAVPVYRVWPDSASGRSPYPDDDALSRCSVDTPEMAMARRLLSLRRDFSRCIRTTDPRINTPCIGRVVLHEYDNDELSVGIWRRQLASVFNRRLMDVDGRL